MEQSYESLARAYLEEERLMEAMVCAKKAIDASPEQPAVRMLLARVYIAKKDKKRASEVLLEALEKWQNYHPARELLEELSR